MKSLFGPAAAGVVLLLAVVAVLRAHSPAEVDAALRALGTLMTVVTGLFSVMWWHQSAQLSRDSDADAPMSKEDAHVLNSAAATSTGLALSASVYTNLAWSSTEANLDAAAFLVLLAISGDELRQACGLSLRQSFRPRKALAFVVLLAAAVLFVMRRIVL